MKRLVLGATGAAVLVVAGAGAASAHVTVSPGEAEAASYTVLTFAVPHGCDGSATTEVAIQIPEQTPSVTPTVNSNWDVEKVMVELDEPIADAHGNELTERVGEIVYTAKTPLPDGMRDKFELSIPMPDTPGETLVFPTVQTCEQGEIGWVQVAADGQDPHSLDEPAPLVTLTAPESGEGHEAEESTDDGSADEVSDTSETADADAADGTDTAASAASEDGSSDGLAIAGLVAGDWVVEIGVRLSRFSEPVVEIPVEIR